MDVPFRDPYPPCPGFPGFPGFVRICPDLSGFPGTPFWSSFFELFFLPIFRMIVDCLLACNMSTDAPQTTSKCMPKSFFFPSSFASRNLYCFGSFSTRFSRCPTLDLIAIYGTFVRSEFFRQVRRSSQNYLPNSFKLTHKRLPNLSKNAHKKNIENDVEQ